MPVSALVHIACPDCGNGTMYRREGCWGAYLACSVYGCQGRRKLDQNGNPREDRAEDSATRQARRMAHRAFDPLWQSAETGKDRKRLRALAYRWLESALGVEAKEAHMDTMDKERCEKVVAVCEGMDTSKLIEWAGQGVQEAGS